MEFNPGKCTAIRVMPKKTKQETSNTSRYLGVSITDIHYCSTKVKAISFTTMVRPIMEHASAAWDPRLQKDIRQLERVRQAAKFCCSDYTNRPPGCDDGMLTALHWESLETRRKNNRLSLLHKINTGHVDITIDLYLQQSDPRTPAFSTDHPALYHSFFPANLRQWNRLPKSLSAMT